MIDAILFCFRLLSLGCGGHQALVLENLALRQQLAGYKRKNQRPLLTRRDRWFWILLSQVWKDWRHALILVHPDTVVRWHRRRFRKDWAELSGVRTPGRPQTSIEIRDLIRRLATENPLWGAPRIHGELLKLGMAVSERTVSRIIRAIQRPSSQTWKPFLQNPVGELVSIDFFTVPTVRFRIVFVFLLLEHPRRKVLHFGITERPTAAWTGQQIMEAFANRDAPRYLIRDRDGVYGNEFRHRLQSLEIKELMTAPQSPWQNGFAERLIGSIRRECLNHVVVLNPRHLRRIMTAYFDYYHRSRTHLALAKDSPDSRVPMTKGIIVAIPEMGGLHHRYERRAA